jgi:hypothetical protein
VWPSFNRINTVNPKSSCRYKTMFQNEHRALRPKAWQSLRLVAESMVQKHSKTSTVPFAPKHGRAYGWWQNPWCKGIPKRAPCPSPQSMAEPMVGGRINGADAFQNEHRALRPKAWQSLRFVAESMVQRHSKTSTVPEISAGMLLGALWISTQYKVCERELCGSGWTELTALHVRLGGKAADNVVAQRTNCDRLRT